MKPASPRTPAKTELCSTEWGSGRDAIITLMTAAFASQTYFRGLLPPNDILTTSKHRVTKDTTRRFVCFLAPFGPGRLRSRRLGGRRVDNADAYSLTSC